MKRTRTEPSAPSNNSNHLSPPSKTQKRAAKDPKPTSARARKASGAAAAAVKKEQEEYPTGEGYPSEPKEEVGVAFNEGESFGLWCGSVEEEVLLGWFPWSGPFWEEEEVQEYYDIWQLQHIHEIPSTPK